jgi:hypothetical protein
MLKMKDLIQEGRKIQETFKKNVVEGATIKKTDKFDFKEDGGSGKPTAVLVLSQNGGEKVSDMFDNMGRPKSSEIKGISDGGNFKWDLHVQPVKYASGETKYKIYGVSGNYTFGNAPTFYPRKGAGNKKSAMNVYSTFIDKFLK